MRWVLETEETGALVVAKVQGSPVGRTGAQFSLGRAVLYLSGCRHFCRALQHERSGHEGEKAYLLCGLLSDCIGLRCVFFCVVYQSMICVFVELKFLWVTRSLICGL